MEKETYDGTIYTGSAGLALYYLNSRRNNNNRDILKVN